MWQETVTLVSADTPLEAHTASPSDDGIHLPVEPLSLGKAFFMEPYDGLRMDREW